MQKAIKSLFLISLKNTVVENLASSLNLFSFDKINSRAANKPDKILIRKHIFAPNKSETNPLKNVPKNTDIVFEPNIYVDDLDLSLGAKKLE